MISGQISISFSLPNQDQIDDHILLGHGISGYVIALDGNYVQKVFPSSGNLCLHKDKKHADEGVYWSLPLAHLRVYGTPVVTTRYNGIDQTQVSFDQPLYLALGSMFSIWHVTEADSDFAVEIVSLLAEADLASASAAESVAAAPRSQIGWLQMMGRAAKTYLDSKGPVRDGYSRLIAYGRRRCGGFLGEEKYHLPPFFGSADIPTAFTLFAPYGDPRKPSAPGTVTERQVDFLRQWANNSKLNLSGAIICYTSNRTFGKTNLHKYLRDQDRHQEKKSAHRNTSCGRVHTLASHTRRHL